MTDAWAYTYPSPLEGYNGLPALPNEKSADGKSYVNPPVDKPSPSYNSFAAPIANSQRGGFDVHVYFQSNDEWQVKYATELWERIRRECKFFMLPCLILNISPQSEMLRNSCFFTTSSPGIENLSRLG
jgi:hypothetical protein